MSNVFVIIKMCYVHNQRYDISCATLQYWCIRLFDGTHPLKNRVYVMIHQYKLFQSCLITFIMTLGIHRDALYYLIVLVVFSAQVTILLVTFLLILWYLYFALPINYWKAAQTICHRNKKHDALYMVADMYLFT